MDKATKDVITALVAEVFPEQQDRQDAFLEAHGLKEEEKEEAKK